MIRNANRLAALASLTAALTAGSAFGVTLSNPSFETPTSGNPDSWGVLSGFDNFVDVEDVSADFAHEGTQSLKFTGIQSPQKAEVFNPNYTTSGDAITPITFNTWAYKPSDNAANNHFVVLGLEFKKLNTPGDPGSGDTFVSYDEVIFETNNFTADTWTPLSITRTAPAAWDVMILHIKLVGLENTSTGALYIDDVSVVPEPASAALFALTGAGLLIRRRRM